MEDKQIKSNELYTELLKTLDNDMIDNHCSDLYCKVTPQTKAIVNRYKFKNHVTTFRDNINNELWYDIPFAYIPYFNEYQKPKKNISIQRFLWVLCKYQRNIHWWVLIINYYIIR